MNIVLRPYQSADDSLIYSTWTKNRWHSVEKRQNPAPNKKEWFNRQIGFINDMLLRGNALIACAQDDPNFILGYGISLNGELIWLYVKVKYRKQGIAKLLRRRLQSPPPS